MRIVFGLLAVLLLVGSVRASKEYDFQGYVTNVGVGPAEGVELSFTVKWYDQNNNVLQTTTLTPPSTDSDGYWGDLTQGPDTCAYVVLTRNSVGGTNPNNGAAWIYEGGWDSNHQTPTWDGVHSRFTLPDQDFQVTDTL